MGGSIADQVRQALILAAKTAPVVVAIDASGCDKTACAAPCEPEFLAWTPITAEYLPDGRPAPIPPGTPACPYIPEPSMSTPDGGLVSPALTGTLGLGVATP